jgi:hypothetical protein
MKSTNSAIPAKTRNSRRKIFAAILIIAIVIGGIFAYWLFLGPSKPLGWIEKGTYATYTGTGNLTDMSIKMEIRLEAIDYNSTHVNLLMSNTLTTSTGPHNSQNTVWLITNEKKYELEGSTLTGTSEESTDAGMLGIRDCTVYSYSNQESTTKFYMDKSADWIVKILVSQNNVDLVSYLADTNVPALK